MRTYGHAVFTTRPELRGTFGMVASTHWLASAAGMAVLERGGNAFDAAVAAGFTLQVVEPHLNGPGGDLPAILWPAGSEPTVLSGSFVAEGTQGTLLSAVNVYDSTMFPALAPGSVKRVRITEGFSSEEGFPNMFGLSEFDGQSRLGEMDLNPDNSFKAVIPANVPVRIQLIDKYGMAVPTTNSPGGNNASEPVWIQGRAGEALTTACR